MSEKKKDGSRNTIISALTFVIIILFLGIYIGILYSLIELIPIPLGFDTKWTWFLSNPYLILNACPFGLKILIIGGLSFCVFLGITIAIYIWKKGNKQIYKWFYGEKNE